MFSLFALPLLPAPPSLSPREMKEVMEIARRIHKVQPKLDEGKYIEYATGIYRAASHYGIESDVLIAITKQETSFRENLPEGAAGELGICQIRKMWISQPEFKNAFPTAKIKDLFRPAKSFMFAAWILKDLQMNSKKGIIPYWSYYNARRFEPRLRYFTAVNRHLNTLSQEVKYVPTPVQNEVARVAWSPEPIRYNNTNWSPEPIQYVGKQKKSPEASWIASAIKKLQQKNNKNKSSHLSNEAIMQAGIELNVLPESQRLAKD